MLSHLGHVSLNMVFWPQITAVEMATCLGDSRRAKRATNDEDLSGLQGSPSHYQIDTIALITEAGNRFVGSIVPQFEFCSAGVPTRDWNAAEDSRATTHCGYLTMCNGIPKFKLRHYRRVE